MQKTLIFIGIFICHILLLLSTGISGWTSALYIESTENFPFLLRFHRNSSWPCDSCTTANRSSKAFQDSSLGPIKSLLNAILGGDSCMRSEEHTSELQSRY